MDKIFNLKIDTKNKNVSTVTGLKQFDNNSVLNITLLQNSLALDLSNCTVRINFLREDERVLLYMANIDNDKEGKVSIKLSPEVLEKSGLVKADISVFDSNLFKITSATFNLRVEKSVYNDTYFTDKDLDLMQQEYVREKERQQAENTRKSNESTRVQAETKRGQNENTRNSNEEARKKAETARVSEWNNVKKDANNLKNTLDTTIDTANKTNNNLKNTINAGDKLKQELNVNNYVTNAKYSEFEKKTNSQYEDIEKALNNFGGRNYIRNSGCFTNFNNWEKHGNVTIIQRDAFDKGKPQGVINIDGGKDSFTDNYIVQILKLEPETTYTISIFYDCGISNTSRMENWNFAIKEANIEKPKVLAFDRFNNGPNKYKKTFTTTKEIEYILNLGGFYVTGGKLNLFNIKLEKGTTATDWTIAPEEVIANSKRLDAIEQTLIEKGFDIAKNKLNI